MENRIKSSRKKPNALEENQGKKDKYKRSSSIGLNGNEAGLTGKGNSLETLEAISESKRGIRIARFRDSGETRADFETAAVATDEDRNDSYADTAKSISELRGKHSHEAPPPFAKEKVMARVRDGSIVYFVPPDDQQLSLIQEGGS